MVEILEGRGLEVVVEGRVVVRAVGGFTNLKKMKNAENCCEHCFSYFVNLICISKPYTTLKNLPKLIN